LTLGGVQITIKVGMPNTLPTRKTVFVVDDDPSMLESVGRLLRQHGFETMLFNSAKALKLHGNFDRAFCIVLDINLSDGSGIELRRSLAVSGVTLPLIFMTGNDGHAIRMAAIQSGCIACLTKPFSAKSLIEAIQRAFVGPGQRVAPA
jgi:FixJ family two-component response regulator